jgi:hypothetical protein
MIKVFVGTSANGEDIKAEQALEYSLRKNCHLPIDITWMRREHGEVFSGWNTKDWQTPFSGFRWAIPSACNFKGRAIYMDVDTVNLRNIDELFEIDMDKPIHARFVKKFNRHETSVMVMDCEKLKNILPSLQELKAGIKPIITKDSIGHLDPRWNCLDGEDYEVTDIWHLHFTWMPSQPWQPAWNTGDKQTHKRPELVKLWNNIYDESCSTL